MIELKAEKSYLSLKVKDEPIVSGQVDAIDVSISFSKDWDGLIKTVVFRSGREARDVLLTDGATTCKIPWEVVSRPGGTLRIGVYGTQGGTKVLPTVWCDVGRIEQGTEPAGNTSAQYEQDTYDRIVGMYESVRETAQSVRDDADAGKFNGRAFTYDDFTPEQLEALRGPQGRQGATGQQGVQGLPGPAGEAGPQGEQGPAGAQGEPGEQGERGEKGEKGDTGADGVTFTPSVSTDGVLSWTNDGGRANPDAVSIKGPQGETGPQGEKGEAAPIVAATGNGGVYTATAGLTSLTNGQLLVVTFDKTNALPAPTLNVDGLGAKEVYRAASYHPEERDTGNDAEFYYAIDLGGLMVGLPYLLCYWEDGAKWLILNYPKISATDLFNSVPVTSGGTGWDSLTSGSYLVGNGDSEVVLKTPAEVLEDIGAPQIEIGSYTGTGTYGTGATKLTFSFTPKLVVIRNSYSSSSYDWICLPYGVTEANASNTSSNYMSVTWGTNTVSLTATASAARQMNLSGKTYIYVAIG